MRNRLLWAAFAVTLAGCHFGTGSAPELKSPPSPFVQQDSVRDTTIASKFTPGGIVRGDKALRWSPAASLSLTLAERELASFSCRVQTAASDWLPLLKFKVAVDKAGQSMAATSPFPLDKAGAEGSFVQTAKLRPDGKAELLLSYACPPANAKDFKAFIAEIAIPRGMAAGKGLRIDGKTIKFPSNADWGEDAKLWVNMLGTKGSELVFAPETPHSGFKLSFPDKNLLVVFRAQREIRIHVRGEFTKPDGKLPMLLDLLEANPGAAPGDSIVAGINFSKCDELEVPVFNPDGNLLMNPSFESGTRYWLSNSGTPFAPNENAICDTDALFGKRSWRLERGQGLSSVSIPILPNQPYTFSFHAKCLDSKPHNVGLSFGTYGKDGKQAGVRVSGDGWKRYESSFSLPTALVKLGVSGEGVLLDGLQLEQSARATTYSGNPFGLELRTDSPDGLVLDAGKPFASTLLLRGPAGATGQLKPTVTDFFKRERLKDNFRFELPASGEQAFNLPLDAALNKGVFVLKAEVEPEGGQAFSDLFRLTRIKYMENAHKHKNIQSINRYAYNKAIGTTPESELAFLRHAGIGAITYADRRIGKPGAQDFQSLKTNGLDWLSVGFAENFGWEPFVWQGKSLYEIETSSPELEQAIEERAYVTAKAFPELKSWYFSMESEAKYIPLKRQDFDTYARWTLAWRRGFKRGNPKAQLIGNDAPCNISEQGISFTSHVIDALNKLAPDEKFDAMAIHTYRNFPEQPDFETALLNFFAALKARGYDNIPVHLNEGAYFYPLNVPAWIGIAPWAGTCDPKDTFASMLTPSYDLGWGEKVAAAMLLRYWLVCHKHADRVDCATPWGPAFLDNRTPYAWLAMSSALADLLGDADFKADVRFAPGARAYVFEDAQKRPVAALWRWTEGLDRGEEAPAPMAVDLGGVHPEFVDMLGNVLTAPRDGDVYTLPLSNFPFYIRCQPGELTSLRSALDNAKAGGGPTLAFSAKLLSRDKAEVTATNQLSKPFAGQVAVDGAPPVELKLAPLGATRLPAKIAPPVPFDHVARIALPVVVDSDKADFAFDAFAVKRVQTGTLKIDADPKDWNGIPALPLPNIRLGDQATSAAPGSVPASDFTASYRLAWAPEALWLLIEVNDDQFVAEHSKPNPASWYENDTVQIFIDTLADALADAARGRLGYNDNDYSYELLPTGDNSAVVYRRNAPDAQLTGGLAGLKPNILEPGVELAFRRANGKQVYEAKFPARYVQPFFLEAGRSAGIGFKLFDRDSVAEKSKHTATNTAPGSDPYARPDVYPTMLLVE